MDILNRDCFVPRNDGIGFVLDVALYFMLKKGRTKHSAKTISPAQQQPRSNADIRHPFALSPV